MSQPIPPTIATALEELTRAFHAVKGPACDPLTAPWDTVDEVTRTVLGGEFQPSQPGHRLYQLRLGALFGERLAREAGGFWFRKRDAVGGFGLGFPEGVFTVSPFKVTALAMVSGKVAGLGTAMAELKKQAEAAKKPGPKLGPDDYERFFDPAFLEFFAQDPKRAKAAWEATPKRLLADLKDAAFRVKPSGKTKEWLETKLTFPLIGLAQDTPLIAQAEKDAGLVERVGELFGARYGTGLTGEEGFANVLLPLLTIDPDKAPTPKKKEGQGALAMFFAQSPRVEGLPDDAILGLFSPEQVSAPDPRLAKVDGLHTFRVNPRTLNPLLQRFDAKAIKSRVEAFSRTLETPLDVTETIVLDGALDWLTRLRDTLALAVRDQLDLCLRRVPETEGQTGEGKGQLRDAVQGG